MRQFPLSYAICVFVFTAGSFVAAANSLASQAAADAPKPNPEARKLKNPVAATPASVAAGHQLFRKYCQFCHGPSGKGDGPAIPKGVTPSDLSDEVWDRGSSDGEIFYVIQQGAGPKFQMKGLKGKITDQDTWNIVNFVRTLGAPAKSH
jgi:mono/diheme cytochrome c family protein